MMHPSLVHAGIGPLERLQAAGFQDDLLLSCLVLSCAQCFLLRNRTARGEG